VSDSPEITEYVASHCVQQRPCEHYESGVSATVGAALSQRLACGKGNQHTKWMLSARNPSRSDELSFADGTVERAIVLATQTAELKGI